MGECENEVREGKVGEYVKKKCGKRGEGRGGEGKEREEGKDEG